MFVTILLYSIFTGFSSFSVSFIDFAIYRFLTGLGVGGEFAVGVALVAEVMPDRARAPTLTLLQMLSATGNITAALINMQLGVLEEEGMQTSPWRIMFLIGALPALLTLVIRAKLKEPEKWQQMAHDDAWNKQLGSYRQLFGHPTWRHHAIFGLMLAFSGVVGLWAIGFYTPDLTKSVLPPKVRGMVFEEQLANAKAASDTDRIQSLEFLRDNQSAIGKRELKVPEAHLSVHKEVSAAVKGRLTFWSGVSSICINVGAFLGMFGFGFVSHYIGRKPTFAIALLAAFFSTISVFYFLNDFSQLFWMVPIMGFCQLSLFAGYAIYFPELFPTHLRSTGTSFCYNVGRFVAALGPAALGLLTQHVYTGPEGFRHAGMTMCVVFLFGLVVLPFLPETRGKPLPE
jgi:MFS family permease